MKRFLSSLTFSLILSLGLVLAHSEFESSVPEDGAVLAEAPTTVVINFEKDIQPKFSVFKVYAIPAEMLAAATTEDGGHSEGETEHSETSSDSSATTEGEHSEGDTHSEEHSGSASHSEGETHGEEGGEHSVMDAAAKLFMPTVIDLTGDEEARADTGIADAGDTAKSVTINLKENLAPGVYAAMFRVLSADTHTVEGFITFEIKPE